MQLINDHLLGAFREGIPCDMEAAMAALGKKDVDFSYLTEAGAVYSSNIEGNSVDVNSFMNMKNGDTPKPKEFEEITDLVSAYAFTQTNPLSQENLLEAHGIFAKRLVSPGNCGKYRQDSVGVFSSHGLVYMAVEAENVKGEMDKLFADIEELRQREVSPEEAVYFASYAHLVFAHIHPFMDGNGRAARLLEKWFLAEIAGENAWRIESERFYWEHRSDYYRNIHLGPNYYECDYSQSLPFLRMLPGAICQG